MKTKIYRSTYKSITSLVMDNGTLQATFLPSQGAKLASLILKSTSREFVLQSGNIIYPEARYEQSYLRGDCAGVDDMFPNIDQCFYDAEPWSGVKLPDHGEVWALPWNYLIEGDQVEFNVKGVRLPYLLSKRVSLHQSKLEITYKVQNLSSFPMDFIWASHMMLSSEKGCYFKFPEGLSKAYTTMSDSGAIGAYGDTFSYPLVQQPNGSMYDIRIHRGPEGNDYQKFYFADKVAEGWGEIHYPDGHRLRVEFPEEVVPYLGVVQGEGGQFNINCMFLEPCTGAFDRPDIAKLHKMNSLLGPNEERQWYLHIMIDPEWIDG
jgi:hypothetical protein